jgi:hypothetical protein
MLDRLSARLGVNRQMNAWAKFVVLLAAIIRDMDPANCDNQQVAIENDSGHDDESRGFSMKYSTSLDRSLQSAWDLLLEERFYALRACLCANGKELHCFRQLLVNLVLGADMSSGYYALQRDSRWNKAFREYGSDGEGIDASNVRVSDEQAASILEHVSLAAQWTHTTQHWENYKRWNACLYLELCNDYENRRLSIDPAKYWYEHELALFDHAVIPLAERLQKPYALGASGSDYLKFAVANRKEWETTQHSFAQSSSCVEYES